MTNCLHPSGMLASKIKRKLDTGLSVNAKYLQQVGKDLVSEGQAELSDDSYKRHVSELKWESSKLQRNIEHIKRLLGETHHNRRQWIEKTPSTELRLATVLSELLCFKISQILLEEFRLTNGHQTVDDFRGKLNFNPNMAACLEFVRISVNNCGFHVGYARIFTQVHNH